MKSEDEDLRVKSEDEDLRVSGEPGMPEIMGRGKNYWTEGQEE